MIEKRKRKDDTGRKGCKGKNEWNIKQLDIPPKFISGEKG